MRTLRGFNTAPDGSAESFGMAHGPGLRVELPMVDDKDDVMQAMVTLLEEEIAWHVLNRLCRSTGWAMMDPETGRTFGGERASTEG